MLAGAGKAVIGNGDVMLADVGDAPVVTASALLLALAPAAVFAAAVHEYETLPSSPLTVMLVADAPAVAVTVACPPAEHVAV
jgi:hypothetical protein